MVEEVVVCVKRLMEKSGDVTDEDKNRHILSLQRKVKSLKEQAGKKVSLYLYRLFLSSSTVHKRFSYERIYCCEF